MKVRLLALGASLALLALGGTASAVALNLTAAPEHKAPPSGPGSSTSAPAAPGQCITVPHACGFPDGTNTGVPVGTTLNQVPAQVASGPGWTYNTDDNEVDVTSNGTVLSDLYIPCDLVIEASDVTVNDVQVSTGGTFGISLRHTAGVTIENSTISGSNATTGRVDSAIADVYGDSTGIVIKNNNISQFRIGVRISTGLIAGNYIHNPGFIHGDHTDGILIETTNEPLTIYGNTIFNNLGQTDDITLDASKSGRDVADKIVVDNLLAGGGYSIYGGSAHNARTSDIVIEDNEFGQLYYPKGGQYGPVAYFNPAGQGNVWSGNVWSGRVRSGNTRSADIRSANRLPGTVTPQPGSTVAG